MKGIVAFKNLLKGEEGATAVEYAMIVGLIALVSFTAFSFLGGQVTRIIHVMMMKLAIHVP